MKKNLITKSKVLLDKQFESLGINSDNSMGGADSFGLDIGAALTALSTGAQSLGKWAAENPDTIVAVADAGLSAASAAQSSGERGVSHPTPRIPVQSASQRATANKHSAISQYLNELQVMSGSMRNELIAKGIITPGAQLEAIRNSFADMLYTGSLSNINKATLIFVIREMDKSIASFGE